jgi:hypothetical protein
LAAVETTTKSLNCCDLPTPAMCWQGAEADSPRRSSYGSSSVTLLPHDVDARVKWMLKK